MKTKSIINNLSYVAAIGLSIFLLFFIITNIWIGHEVRQTCQEAKWKHAAPDCVTALVAMLEDKSESFRLRNHAIWALGQFGDKRALPALQRYYTGTIPDREPLDRTISQYELKKAIELANGGTNITVWAWRWSVK